MASPTPSSPLSPPVSPSSLLRGRYAVSRTEPGMGLMEGVDKLSRTPKNLKVVIFAFDDRDEYNRVLGHYRKCRSRFVANLIDSWEEDTVFYIVVEKGMLRVNELAEVRKVTDEERASILREALAAWLFLYEQRLVWLMNPETFMQYPSGWRVVDLRDSVDLDLLGPLIPNFLACDADLAGALVDRTYSFVSAAPASPQRSLGTAALEYILLLPLFAGVDGPGLVRYAELDETQLATALGPAATPVDRAAVRLLQLVLSADAVPVERVTAGLRDVADLIVLQQLAAGPTPGTPKSPQARLQGPGFLPAIL